MMTMQRPITTVSSNNDMDIGPPQQTQRSASDSLGSLSSAHSENSQSQSAIAAATSTSFPSSTSQLMGPHGLWGQSSTLSSAPLLSPSELAGAAESKAGSSHSNDPFHSLLMEQMRQRLQQEKGQNQLETDSNLPPSKRPRLLAEGAESRDSSNPFLSAGNAGSPLGASLLLSATGSLAPWSASSPLSPSSSLGLSSMSSLSGIGLDSGSGNFSQIQQLLRKQQLQELQQLQQLKQREDLQRISQLQSRDAVLQIMLMQQQQEQQQQQQALSLGGMDGSSSVAAQLKALQDQQHKAASSLSEDSVASFMRKASQNDQSVANSPHGQNNLLEQVKALAKFDQGNDGMPPPPSMVSAVSSLDSIAIMSMLLPSNQQSQNATVAAARQQAASASSTASRFLGTDLSLSGASGLGSNLNSSLLSPLPLPSSLGNLGMAPSAAASLFGGFQGGGSLSNLMGRTGANVLGGGAGSLALHPSAADVIYEQRRLAAAAEVSNTVRDSSVGKPADAFVDRDPDGRAHDLPTLLVVPMDHMQLSSHQTLLRYQIEVFRAGEEDTSTHTRGRNKPVQLGQIGIRCRHCKVLPVSRRKRGSVYFPRAVEGFYQAAQNMNSTHLQTGECPLMGNALRQEFANLIATRGVSTGAGRAYWAKQARKLGLRNTETGIVFDKKEPEGVDTDGNADICKKVNE